MLVFRQISKRLSGKQVFEHLNFSFQKGVNVLEGPNGAGKTTLLRMVTGVLAPDEGEITWLGRSTTLLRQRIGICPADDDSFYPALTVRQNIVFFSSLYGIRPNEIEHRIRELCPFQIDYLDSPLERCSLGMKQKAKIARALLHAPELLLLDEPLNGLDQAAREKFLHWIGNRTGTTLLVQHGLSAKFRRARLESGRIEAC